MTMSALKPVSKKQRDRPIKYKRVYELRICYKQEINIYQSFKEIKKITVKGTALGVCRFLS